MQEVLTNQKNKVFMVIIMCTLLIASLFIPSFAMASQDDKIEAIASSVFYNTETNLYEVNKDIAVGKGLTEFEANQVKSFFEGLSIEEVVEVNEEIGFDPSKNDNEFGTFAIPLVLIPIAKFLVGTAGAVIVSEVVLYGIAKACQNLEGRYAFFTDFCKTRGYI